jgi:hypothetical protein
MTPLGCIPVVLVFEHGSIGITHNAAPDAGRVMGTQDFEQVVVELLLGSAESEDLVHKRATVWVRDSS